MRRPTVKRPDDFDANPRHDVDRETIEAHVGVVQRRLIAAKAGRSGTRDTARRIETITPAASTMIMDKEMRGRALGRARAGITARTGSRHCIGGVAGAGMGPGLPPPGAASLWHILHVRRETGGLGTFGQTRAARRTKV